MVERALGTLSAVLGPGGPMEAGKLRRGGQAEKIDGGATLVATRADRRQRFLDAARSIADLWPLRPRGRRQRAAARSRSCATRMRFRSTSRHGR